MTTLEKLSNYIASEPYVSDAREMFVEAKAEIERLEKENAFMLASLENIQKCADRLSEQGFKIEYWTDGKWHCLRSSDLGSTLQANAETLPLAICLFAKEIFSK